MAVIALTITFGEDYRNWLGKELVLVVSEIRSQEYRIREARKSCARQGAAVGVEEEEQVIGPTRTGSFLTPSH